MPLPQARSLKPPPPAGSSFSFFSRFCSLDSETGSGQHDQHRKAAAAAAATWRRRKKWSYQPNFLPLSQSDADRPAILQLDSSSQSVRHFQAVGMQVSSLFLSLSFSFSERVSWHLVGLGGCSSSDVHAQGWRALPVSRRARLRSTSRTNGGVITWKYFS
jgi:hypothetical protein